MNVVVKALLLALLLVPGALAQGRTTEVPAVPAFPGKGEPGGAGLSVSMQIQTVDDQFAPLTVPWFLAGHDNLVNVTIYNGNGVAWNGSFRVNATGASATPETLAFEVAPNSRQSRIVTVHPEDLGDVSVTLESIDAFYPGGEPVKASLDAPALLVPSVRFIDPPVGGGGDDEFQLVDMFGGQRSAATAYVRLRPGEPLGARLEVRNDLAVPTSPFSLSLGGSRDIGPTDVRSLAPGESVTIDMPEFLPVEAPDYGGRYFGPMGRVEIRAIGTFSLAQVSTSVHLASYKIDAGAVQEIGPATAVIDVQEGLSIDLLVPRDPRLGVPTRLKVNVSNLGTESVTGSLVVTLQTPNALFYGVQGPESRAIHVNLGPGEKRAETVEFTPRVTGQWSINTVFQSGEGFGYGGGGGGFEVEGPVRIAFDSLETVYARIGEPVRIDLTIDTERPLQGAQLAVTTGTPYYGSDLQATGGAYSPGFVHSILRVDASTSDLGTLRPGGTVNASVEVTGRSSGRYSVVPYVLAEGFAFTSRPFDPSEDDVGFDLMRYMGSVAVAVQPRAVPAPMALLPLTIGLAVFVGAWTLRTRFVR